MFALATTGGHGMQLFGPPERSDEPTRAELEQKCLALAEELLGYREEATRQEVKAAMLLQWESNGDPSLGPFDRMYAFAERYVVRASEQSARARQAEERAERHGKRIAQLEQVLQSATARAMKMVSASAGQQERAQVAERIARVLEDHEACHQFLNERGVPGADTLRERLPLYSSGFMVCAEVNLLPEPLVNPGSRDESLLGEAYEVQGHGASLLLTFKLGELEEYHSIEMTAAATRPLASVFARALVELGRGAHRVDSYSLADVCGAALDPLATIADLKLEDGAVVHARRAASEG